VSRALSSLKRNGIITFTGTRQVAILNRGAIGTSTGFGQAAEDRRGERERRLAADSSPFAPGAFATPQAKRAG
jgi:hypothetical protein